MTRICVLCLGDHPSFDCSSGSEVRSHPSLLTPKKEMKQVNIMNFCSVTPKVKSEVTTGVNSGLPRVNLTRNSVLMDDNSWLLSNSTWPQSSGDSDVTFIKSIVPLGPIPFKAQQKGQPVSKVYVDKSTSTIITADQLITLEEHEAILQVALEQKPVVKGIKLARLKSGNKKLKVAKLRDSPEQGNLRIHGSRLMPQVKIF